MADSKITALTALTAADPVNDMFPVVDVSDTSMAASGTTKRISANNILSSSPTASGALTVTGLVTAGSASITGAATVGTTLGVTGVSTFAAGTALLPALTTTGDTNTGIYYPAADTFAVTTSGAEGLRVNSTANLVLKGGTTTANGVGLTFPATQVASSDANCLDDYEEGAWVPTITGQVNCTAVTSVSAQYTKVGRLVTLSGYATASVTTANLVTYFSLSSLPFTAAALTVGSLMENATYNLGTSQVSGTTLYGIFSAVAQLTTGAKDFYYSITYSV